MTAWRRWLLVGVVVAAGAAVTAGQHGHGAAAASDDTATLQSRQLAAAPDLVGLGGEVLTGVLRQCDAAHQQEVAYATANGKAGER